MSQPAVRAIADIEDGADEARLLLTVMEAAQKLGIGRSLMYELIADGRIPSIRIGRLRRIPREALADFAARGC